LDQPDTATDVRTGYALVNGLRLYYELHGAGEPLILLHGGVGSTKIFGELLPALCPLRQVIAVDLQAHGRTADIDRPLRFETMADDIAGLLKHLGIDRADMMGYSLGGGVALRTAIQHGDAVKKLVVVAFAYKRSGWYPEIRDAMVQRDPEKIERMKESSLYKAYAEIAPRSGDWPVLFQKLTELLGREYDWSNEIASVKAPTLLAFGDADSVSPQHAAEFFELLGGGKKDGGWSGAGMCDSQLAIVPGTTHYNIVSSPLLLRAVKQFLGGSAGSA
jgi:pimeloyl-ACP methyl ester carboxylesterase